MMNQNGTDPRSNLSAVHILLPVWGFKYIKQMLEFCIPTLLSSGNIPSVAASVKTKFILLTRLRDSTLVEGHPSWIALGRICETEIRSIDDLITRDNHTAVITLAFHRAIAEAGAARKDICFIFMNSDFLIANRSIRNVVARMEGGSSAVLAGNFQVVAEEAAPIFRRKVDADARKLEMSSRDLAEIGFSHLHPATIANVVNFGVSHNDGANRLFWRVDANTLLGRFFLIHVVAIRPETIGDAPLSSYDYSFIPEMCPSGNIHLVQDSDEYFAIEMQPNSHEASQLRRGPLSPASLARTLSIWTTSQHRSNASKTICFHSKAIPQIDEIAAEADKFVKDTLRFLATPPVPYNSHPYWLGSIVAHEERKGLPMTSDKWASLTKPSVSAADRLKKVLVGMAPDVSIFHPKWRDYSDLILHLRDSTARPALFICHDPFKFSGWLLTQKHVQSFQIETFTSLTDHQFLPLLGRFERAFVHLTSHTFRHGRSAITRLAATLIPGGKLFVLVEGEDIVRQMASILNLDFRLVQTSFRSEAKIAQFCGQILRRLAERRHGVLFLLFGIPAAGLIAISNLLPRPKARARVTSALLELINEPDAEIKLPDDLYAPTRDAHVEVSAAAALLVAGSEDRSAHPRNLVEASELIEKVMLDRGGA